MYCHQLWVDIMYSKRTRGNFLVDGNALSFDWYGDHIQKSFVVIEIICYD